MPQRVTEFFSRSHRIRYQYITNISETTIFASANFILQIEPENIDAYELISLALEGKGDKAAQKANADKILEIDPSTIEAKRIALAKEAERLRLEQLRKEVEKEIKEDAEREALKKQILEEMKAKQKSN